MLKSGYDLTRYFLLFFLLIFTSCKDQQNDTFDFTGEWTIEAYRIYTEIDNEVINAQTAEDAGFFRFMKEGSGLVTILVPGISLVDNPISWNYHQGDEELIIDYQTGQAPFNYQVTFQSGDRVFLRYEIFTQSSESTSLFRNTIELLKEK